MEWVRGQQYEIEQFYRDRSTEIKRDYAKAVKAGDSEAAAAARKEWLSLQEGKDRVRPFFGNNPDALKRQNMSTLLKYPRYADDRAAHRSAELEDAF